MSKHLSCDGPNCSAYTSYPTVRWLTLTEYTDLPPQRSMKGPRHFCGLVCLRGWTDAPASLKSGVVSAADLLDHLLYGPVTSVATVGPSHGKPTVASTASEPEHDTAPGCTPGPVKNTAL